MERRKFLKSTAGTTTGILSIGLIETVSAEKSISVYLYRGPSLSYSQTLEYCDRMEKLWNEDDVFANDHIDFNVVYGGYVSESTLDHYADGDGGKNSPRDGSDEISAAWNNYCHDNDLYSAYESHHWIGNFYNWSQNYGSVDGYVGRAGAGRIIPYNEMDIEDCSDSVGTQGEYYDGYRAYGVTSTHYLSGDRRNDNVVFGTLIHEFGHNAMHPAHEHHNMYDYSGSSGYPYDPTCMAYSADDCTAGESQYYSSVDDNSCVWGKTCGYTISTWLMYGEAYGSADSPCQVAEACSSLKDASDTAEDLALDPVLPAESDEKAKEQTSDRPTGTENIN